MSKALENEKTLYSVLNLRFSPLLDVDVEVATWNAYARLLQHTPSQLRSLVEVVDKVTLVEIFKDLLTDHFLSEYANNGDPEDVNWPWILTNLRFAIEEAYSIINEQ